MAEPSYERFASHDGVEIAYREGGQGRPVVLVHGYTVTSTWNFALHRVTDENGRRVTVPGPTVESVLVDAGFQVVLMDLRGHGHSDKPHDRERYAMNTFADDVRALVDHLGLQRSAVVGYSFGPW